MVLEKAVRTAEIRTELPTTKGTKLGLAYTDDIDLVGNSDHEGHFQLEK